jgi:hypothetical protein
VDPLPLLFPSFTLWMATAAWSYGKHDRMPTAAPACGFEIAVCRPFVVALDLATAECPGLVRRA